MAMPNIDPRMLQGLLAQIAGNPQMAEGGQPFNPNPRFDERPAPRPIPPQYDTPIAGSLFGQNPLGQDGRVMSPIINTFNPRERQAPSEFRSLDPQGDYIGMPPGGLSPVFDPPPKAYPGREPKQDMPMPTPTPGASHPQQMRRIPRRQPPAPVPAPSPANDVQGQTAKPPRQLIGPPIKVDPGQTDPPEPGPKPGVRSDPFVKPKIAGPSPRIGSTKPTVRRKPKGY